MRRLALSCWLLLAAVLAVPAAAQDPVEYLLQGKDEKRGNFQGRLELRVGPDGVRVVRKATFREGIELLEGKGSRQGNELRVELPAPVGLAGAVLGNQPQPPIKLQAKFTGQDAKVSDTLKRAGALYAKETGQRVDAPYGTTNPTPESSSHTYKTMVGVPFVKGEGDAHEVDINDVKQGGLGDCYFMAGLAAVARAQPERVRSMIERNADGTFTVYAWRHNDQWEDEVEEYERTAIKVVVDAQFPSGYSGPAYAEFTGDTETVGTEVRQELWPMLFEKAYAQSKGSYAGIEAGYASTSMSFFGGDQVEDYTPSDLTIDELRALLQDADKAGRPMALGVPESEHSLGIHGNHYYTFWGFDAEGRVLLYNPWGSSHPPRGLTLEEVQKFTDTVHIGPR
jgi:hypothetical protein